MIYDLFLLCHHPENRELLPAQRAPLSQSLAVAGFWVPAYSAFA